MTRKRAEQLAAIVGEQDAKLLTNEPAGRSPPKGALTMVRVPLFRHGQSIRRRLVLGVGGCLRLAAPLSRLAFSHHRSMRRAPAPVRQGGRRRTLPRWEACGGAAGGGRRFAGGVRGAGAGGAGAPHAGLAGRIRLRQLLRGAPPQRLLKTPRRR